MSKTVRATTFHQFLDLPPELREQVYTYAFTPPTIPSTTAILNELVPNSTPLRQTSRLIHQDSARIYRNATKHFALGRKQIQDSIIADFEAVIPAGTPDALVTPRAKNVIKLARSLREPSTCKHATTCPPQTDGGQCYFCSSPAHHQCLDCGKHLTIALLGHIHVMPNRRTSSQTTAVVPLLVLPSSSTQGEKFTKLGEVILRMGDLPKTRLFPVGNPARSFVCNFYALELRKQRAVELRCWVRKAAINKFWASKDPREFCERTLRAIEAQDKRMGRVLLNEKLWSDGHDMVWRREFARRAVMEAGATGSDIRRLLPA